jgi:hypothetical protein
MQAEQVDMDTIFSQYDQKLQADAKIRDSIKKHCENVSNIERAVESSLLKIQASPAEQKGVSLPVYTCLICACACVRVCVCVLALLLSCSPSLPLLHMHIICSGNSC